MKRLLRSTLRPAILVLSVILTGACLVPASPGTSSAGPPPPPGGHHPVSYGGDNTAPYPPLVATTVEEPSPEPMPQAFLVTTSPNPFRRTTTLRFFGVEGSVARVRIFTLAGRLVREIPHDVERRGWQEISWDGQDRSGRTVPAGPYFYRVESAGRIATGKVVFLP